MKYTHKLFTVLVLLGSAGFLVAVNATIENKTRYPITLYYQMMSAPPAPPTRQEIGTINPNQKTSVSLSAQTPVIYLNFLDQGGFITLGENMTASGAISYSINAQHPKLNIQQTPMAVDPIEFVITEK